MLTETNFSAALKAMNFIERGNVYEKTFADGVVMTADLKAKKLFYPAQIKGRERNTDCDESHRENLVVFECVNRLLEKGYKPADIELERQWQLGHSPKGGRADICVSSGGKTLFIIECKTAGDEFDHEVDNMLADGGQLFSYWQQETSCQWLMLYASTFDEKSGLCFNAKCVSCDATFYGEAATVSDRFKIWSDRFEKFFFDDVIFHDETRAYQIGVKPLRKRDLRDLKDRKEHNSVINQFEEILRHNQVSDKENAFNRLVALFICKLVDEDRTPNNTEVAFQFKFGTDTRETFQDRLQKLYSDGMKKFMGEDIFYLPDDYPDKLFKNFADDENHDKQVEDLRENFRKLKFYTNNEFAFVEVSNEKLFRLNSKVLVEVVRMFQNYRIIGSQQLQLLGDLFENLLDKGFKQDEGQFFTPTPIARFIWDSLPLDKIIFADNKGDPPKVIDYACGAGHFLTEGFKAINDCFARRNVTPPVMWEYNKLFGVEKDYRLARVSKISLFMHGAGAGNIKFGDGLENYPDENIAEKSFNVLVANPPYSIKKFKAYLHLTNKNFATLKNISNDGSEIETLFAERISQLVKSKGVAAVILPSSILNKDGKSFVAARESLLKSFFVRAVVELKSKTFSATGTNTIVIFLERFDEPPRVTAELEDIASTILSGKILERQITQEVFAAYTKKIGVASDDYQKFIARAVDFDKWDVPYFVAYAAKFKPSTAKNISDEERLQRNNQDFYKKVAAVEYEKIVIFATTFRQRTLIVTAPDNNKEQETFLGYGWSNAKGREGIDHKNFGGLLFDENNRDAEDKIAAVIRAAFRGEEINSHALEKYFHYVTLADTLNFDAIDFTKKISLGSKYAQAEYAGRFPTVKLGDVAPFVTERTTIDEISIADFVTTDNMLKDKRGIKTYEGEPQISGLVKFSAGDVLVSNIRPYLKKIWLSDRAGGCSPDVLVFRARDEKILRPEYLFEILRQDDFFAFTMATASGMKMPRGDKDKIQTYRFPLPPVNVQKKIVVEFQTLDANIAALDDEVQKLDADIQEKFSALFGDTRHGYKYLTDSFEKFVYVRGGDTFKGKYQGSTNSEDIPFYKVSDMNSSGNEKIMDKANNYVSEKILVAEMKATIFDEGTIIFPKVGMAIGTNKKRILGRRAAVDNNIMAIWRKNDLLNNEYLFAFLNFCFDLSSVASKANPPSINVANFNRAKIMIPPIELQKEFADFVETCEARKISARARRADFVREHEELVTKYFR